VNGDPMIATGQRDFFRERGEFTIPPLLTSAYLHSNKLSVNFPMRFRRKITKTEAGCWLWAGTKLSDGYGLITRGAPFKGQITAHRAAWILSRGPIPAGLDVLHNCPGGDCPGCVNPAHLWLGSHADNMRDKIAKRRTTRGVLGVSHKLSDELAGQILDLARHRIFPQAQIAADYGISVERLKQLRREERETTGEPQ
jgi:hypothetical protein